jgi:predicted alpha-1,2-mannosidase
MIEHVDPFIGVDGAGNCLPGPYLPFSLVRLGPDTLFPQSTNGYSSKRPIVGFSHNHVSGTGGGGRYGNVAVTPFTGPARTRIEPQERRGEQAECGYYTVTLTPSEVRAELTVTPRVGVHRYTFPAGAEANLLVDVGAVVQRGEGRRRLGGDTGVSTGGFVEWVTDNELVGRGDFRGGWGHEFPYSVHFYARFETPVQQRFAGNHRGFLPTVAADGPNCVAIAGFGEARQVDVKVGLSYVSVAKARASVEREAAGRTFEAIRKDAADTWEKALSRVRVEGGTDAQRTLLYTLLTRLLCMPSDLGVDDEFGFWHSGVRQFTDIYCLWDSVRNANSLLTLIDPRREIDLLNCELDIADHLGWLADAWIAGHSAAIQGGSSADVLFCEAKLKGLGDIDYQKALGYMRKNAEVASPDPYLYGRYDDDRELGFVSTNVRNCVSRHLEYRYQDWCIGRLAAELGESELAGKFFDRSRGVWDLWREDIRYFAPKTPDGRWAEPFDPFTCAAKSWEDPYFMEGRSVLWSFNTQHDFAGLVARHGGPEGFVKHLDWVFDNDWYRSKETFLHVPWLYHYAGAPERSVERARAAMERFFRPERNGLSDNEDMGCQSAYYICSAMGLYPIMGQDLYLLASPVFERVEIDPGEDGPAIAIEAPGAGADRPYVTAATLNGEPLDRAWVRHGELTGGAEIRYELSDEPGAWGRRPPPSPLGPEG